MTSPLSLDSLCNTCFSPFSDARYKAAQVFLGRLCSERDRTDYELPYYAIDFLAEFFPCVYSKNKNTEMYMFRYT